MKILVTNYTFSAAAKTITFGDYGSIVLDSVLLITNVTDNVIIYNFASAGLGGTVATNVLTLDYDTTSMSDTDDLQIFYEDTAQDFTNDATNGTLVNLGANNDVTVASLPLPTGAATAALQTQPGVDIGDVTVNNAAGASAVNIQDGGNSITVDGTVTANLAAGTNNIGDVDVLTINGVAPAFGSGVRGATVQRVTVATDDLVPVSASSLPLPTGAATAALQTQPGVDIGDVTINNAAGASAVNIQDGGNSITVDGTVAISGTVAVTDNAGSLTVDNPTLSVVGGGVEATALRVTIASDSTGLVSVDDNGGSLTVDYATTGSGTATGALRVELPTNGTGVIASVGSITNALPAGTNAIGKLAANSGVDIGDVDVTSVIAGTGATNIGKAEDAAHTTGDTGVMALGVRKDTPTAIAGTDGDYIPPIMDANGATWVSLATKLDSTNDAVAVGVTTGGGATTFHLVSAATTNATNIKASAGQVYGWYIYNSNAAARKVAFHNTSGTPTAGASVYFSLMIPAGGAANVSFAMGIPFSSGIGITTVTGLADSDSAAVAANDLIINIFYK